MYQVNEEKCQQEYQQDHTTKTKTLKTEKQEPLTKLKRKVMKTEVPHIQATQNKG